MSIDAKIIAIKKKGTEVSLVLGQRTKRNPAGQRELRVVDFDGWLPDLGSEIWGNSGQLYIGDTHVYNRISPTRVRRAAANKACT